MDRRTDRCRDIEAVVAVPAIERRMRVRERRIAEVLRDPDSPGNRPLERAGHSCRDRVDRCKLARGSLEVVECRLEARLLRFLLRDDLLEIRFLRLGLRQEIILRLLRRRKRALLGLELLLVLQELLLLGFLGRFGARKLLLR